MNSYLRQISILYVEDDEDVREAYEKTLKRSCKHVFTACDGVEGLKLYKQHKPDIVISDIKMPHKNGIEMAKEIKEIDSEQSILFTTAHTESDFTLKALDLQADGYITKPVEKKILIAKLTSLAKNIINEKENRRKSQILQGILDNQSNMIILTDFDKIEFASKSFFELMEVKDTVEFSEKYHDILTIFAPQEEHISATTKEEFLLKYNNTPKDKRVVSITKGTNQKTLYASIDSIDMDEDRLYVISLIDITILQQEKIKAQYNASHDFLTGIYNREKFSEVFDIEFLRSQRYQRPLSIAMLDIDHFKEVNDTYGHLIGDEILKELASYCLLNIRKTDTIARWGGEEFILIMSETDIEKSKEVCETLRKGVSSINFANLYHITISIGVTQMREDDTKNGFLKRVDEALYKAKNEGRDKVVVN